MNHFEDDLSVQVTYPWVDVVEIVVGKVDLVEVKLFPMFPALENFIIEAGQLGWPLG